jgi:hypothetical protein
VNIMFRVLYKEEGPLIMRAETGPTTADKFFMYLENSGRFYNFCKCSGLLFGGLLELPNDV